LRDHAHGDSGTDVQSIQFVGAVKRRWDGIGDGASGNDGIDHNQCPARILFATVDDAAPVDVVTAEFGIAASAASQAASFAHRTHDGLPAGSLPVVWRERFAVNSHDAGNATGALYRHDNSDLGQLEPQCAFDCCRTVKEIATKASKAAAKARTRRAKAKRKEKMK
jgi:hypothetical protein